MHVRSSTRDSVSCTVLARAVRLRLSLPGGSIALEGVVHEVLEGAALHAIRAGIASGRCGGLRRGPRVCGTPVVRRLRVVRLGRVGPEAHCRLRGLLASSLQHVILQG